jgi:hypothetical protein
VNVGAALRRPPGTEPVCLGNEQVLAWVGGQAVTAGDVRALLGARGVPAGLGTTADLALRWAFGVTLMEAVVAVNGRRRGCDGARALREAVCAEDLEAKPVRRGELRAYYENNLHLYQRPEVRRVRHVRAPSLGEALSQKKKIAGGDEHGLVVGDLGWVCLGELAGALEDAIFAAEPGRWTGPVPAVSSWHLVRVEEVRHARALVLDEVEAGIREVIVRARSAAAWATWVERHLVEDIVLAPGVPSPFGPGAFGGAHRH